MYRQSIFRILKEAGPAGLSVRKIARHVYNEQNTLFDDVDFAVVHRSVQQYLTRNSRRPKAMYKPTGTWGTYRLNMRSPKIQELLRGSRGEAAPENTPSEQQLPLLFD